MDGYPMKPPQPDNLDRYLRQQESRFDDIRSGACKRIRWCHPKHPHRTDLAIVYVHGFSATCQEVQPLCEQLADTLGTNLFYTRLTGHGRTSQAMATANLESWIEDAKEAARVGHAIGRRTVWIGTSTGALLCLLAAAGKISGGYPHSVVLLAPNFRPRHLLFPLMRFGWMWPLMKVLGFRQRGFKPSNRLHATYWTTRYPLDALRPMVDLVAAVDVAVLRAVRVPLLAIWDPGDRIVSAVTTRRRLARVVAARKKTVLYRQAADPQRHVLAGEALSPDSTRYIADLIARFITHPV